MPSLLSIGTATPNISLAQHAIAEQAKKIFDSSKSDIDRLQSVYDRAGIQTRYSPLPLEWFLDHNPGWKERSELFLKHALDLLEAAARDAIKSADITFQDIDILVIVSSSGISVPSLDALLMERCNFRRDVMRLPIFGLGCAGGVLGLARAAAMAKGHPQSNVLFCVVELCTLTFRRQDQSKSNIVATALFGDGAAAAVLTSSKTNNGLAFLSDWGEYTWPDSAAVMGWKIEDDGMGVIFSPDIPRIILRDFRRVADQFLKARNVKLSDFDGFIFHPGGEKVVAAIEQSFDLPIGSLYHAREVLKDFGNMSAATILFVLARTLKTPLEGRHLMGAFGPGFSAGFILIEAN